MSRIIEILEAIRNGTPYTGEALSRVEAILKSISDRTEYTDIPKSRHEKLLLAIKNGGASDLLMPRSRVEEILVAVVNRTLDDYLVGKNLFDISKIKSTKTLKNSGDGTLVIAGGSYYTRTGVTFRELCPLIKAGDTCVLKFETASETSTFFYLREEWYSGASKVLTDAMLDDKLVIYGYHSAEEAYGEECVISNIKVEFGTKPSQYTPYVFKSEIEEAYCLASDKLKGV